MAKPAADTNKALRRLKNENKIFIGAIKNVSWLVFWLFVGTIMYSVRYYKFETFSYWLICFGLVFGILAVQENRDRRLREMGMTADDMQPDPA